MYYLHHGFVPLIDCGRVSGEFPFRGKVDEVEEPRHHKRHKSKSLHYWCEYECWHRVDASRRRQVTSNSFENFKMLVKSNYKKKGINTHEQTIGAFQTNQMDFK